MEQRTAGVVEITVAWGDEVLDVRHVSPRRGFAEDAPLDAPVVIERESAPWCAIPDGARAHAVRSGAPRAIASSLVPLRDDEVLRVEHRGLAYTLRRATAASALPRDVRPSRSRAAWLGVSFAAHALIVTMFWLTPPRTFALPPIGTRAAPPVRVDLADEGAALLPVVPGERHLEREGALGSREERRARGRSAVPRRANDPASRLGRTRESMQSIGAIGAVRAILGSWSAPASPYGPAQPHGDDMSGALGAMMGDRVADRQGSEGLGMRGTGRGAGGTGRGTIGVSALGTIGLRTLCSSCGARSGSGYGRGEAALATRRSHVVIDRCGGYDHVRGGLSPEAIRRVVRRHLGEVRFCYEQGLAQNPSLEGRVAVHWIIDGDGRVQRAGLTSSDLASASVEQCIVGAVRRWTFPAHEDRSPTGVAYPFVLQSR